MEKFELFIFDLDGTLIDTRKDLTTAVNIMRDRFHLPPLDVDTVTRMVGDGIRKLVERSLEEIKNVDIGHALEIFSSAYSEHLVEYTKPYSGVNEVLQTLKDMKKKMAVLTNKSRDFTIEILKKFGLYNFFDIVVGSDDLTKRKPDPEGIVRIISTLKRTEESERSDGKISSEGVLMIGDSKNDILSARNAGVKSAYVSYGYTDLKDVKDLNPDYVFNDITDLLKIL